MLADKLNQIRESNKLIPHTTTQEGMQTFEVDILIVPTILHTQLTGEGPHTERVYIQGYTLEDAKKRAGIQ